MDYFSVYALFFSFCLYQHSCTQVLPHLLIRHSHYLEKLLLQLIQFHPNIYPHRPLDPAIADTILPGGLQATLNGSISATPTSVCDDLVLISTIYGLYATLNASIYTSPASVWDRIVLVSSIYIPISITSSLINISIRQGIV